MPPSRAQEDIEPLTQRVGELQRYLIDLKGYIVIENALSESEIDNLNLIIDDQLLPPPTTYNRFGTAPLGSGFLGWHSSFIPLVDHESVINILQFLLGPFFSLGSIYGIYEDRFVGEPLGKELRAHANEGTETNLTCSVIWNITDAGPGIGGFCCIDGSHHVRGSFPSSMYDTCHRSDLVVTPYAPAGSAVVITARLLRGDSSWLGPHQRRSLVFEYTTAKDTDPKRRIALPTYELTRQQEAILGYSDV